MMPNVSNWDDKDDLDLDAADLAAMADSGEDVAIVGPKSEPGGGVLFTAPTSVGARTVITEPALCRPPITIELMPV
jgi:hypothetical protein